MDLLDKYGDVLRQEDLPSAPVSEPQTDSSATNFSQVSAALLALLVSLTAGFIG